MVLFYSEDTDRSIEGLLLFWGGYLNLPKTNRPYKIKIENKRLTSSHIPFFLSVLKYKFKIEQKNVLNKNN